MGGEGNNIKGIGTLNGGDTQREGLGGKEKEGGIRVRGKTS